MIPAIIPAAGESRRMGAPKMLMKWGNGSVLGRVIAVFADAGVKQILVITGAYRDEVEKHVQQLAGLYPVRCVFNAAHGKGGMLSSIQRGLEYLAKEDEEAALIGLGDQPQAEERTVRLILDEYQKSAHRLIVPSYESRRGHPWLLGREYWGEVLRMRPPQTLRDFLNQNANGIRYVDAESASILADLDTPADYSTSHSS